MAEDRDSGTVVADLEGPGDGSGCSGRVSPGLEAFGKMLGIIRGEGVASSACPVAADPISGSSCAACGRSGDVEEDLEHRAGHADPEGIKETVESRTCTYCGKVLPTRVVRELHSMRVSYRELAGGGPSCARCWEVFYDAAERDAHWCDVPDHSSAGSRLFACPLGCPGPPSAAEPELQRHLAALHGCDPGEVTAVARTGEVTVVKSEFRVPCPNCGVQINTLNVPLETHLIFSCRDRGPVLAEMVRGIRDLAGESGLDPHLLVALELEAKSRTEAGKADGLPGRLRKWKEQLDRGWRKRPWLQKVIVESQRQVRCNLRKAPKNQSQNSSTKEPDSVPKSLKEQLGFDIRASKTTDLDLLREQGFEVGDNILADLDYGEDFLFE